MMEKWFGLWFLAVAQIALMGCSRTVEVIRDVREYRAYDQAWRYESVVRVTYGALYVMDVYEHHQTMFLETEQAAGKIPVHKRIYALRRDGTYGKVKYDTSGGAVQSVDNVLFLSFRARNRDVTDCLALEPYGLPSKRSPRWVEFFAEFDPVKQVFLVNSFNKGVDFSDINGKDGTTWLKTATPEEVLAREYLHRTPFICDEKEIAKYQQ